MITGFSCPDNTEEVRILFEQVPDFIFYDERCPGPLEKQNALRGKSSKKILRKYILHIQLQFIYCDDLFLYLSSNVK